MSARIDDKTPMTVKSPTGDVIQVMTWAGVANKFEYLFGPIIQSCTGINQSLNQISEKLDEWVEPETPGE